MGRSINTVPAKPFSDWLNSRLPRYAGVRDMAENIGCAERTLNRWLRCAMDTKENGVYVSRPAEVYELETVEEALHKLGFFLWDVYPEEDYPELYGVVEETRLKPTVILLHPVLIVRARELYEMGDSLTEVAEQLLTESRYASVEGLERSLLKEFINQDWPRRSQSERQRLVWAKGQAIANPCQATNQAGRRCGRAANESGFCVSHDPAHRDVVLRATIVARKQRLADPELPLGPFQRFISRRIREASSANKYARAIGKSPSCVLIWRNGVSGEGVPKTAVRLATVLDFLERDGTATLADLYPEYGELAA